MQQCPICFSLIQIRSQLDCCRHHFCYHCISQWAAIQNSCPICKRRFTTITQLLPPHNPVNTVQQIEVITHIKPEIKIRPIQFEVTSPFAHYSTSELIEELGRVEIFLSTAREDLAKLQEIHGEMVAFQGRRAVKVQKKRSKKLKKVAQS